MSYKGTRGRQQHPLLHPLPKISNRIKLFWIKVDKRSQLECWEWKASLKNGYGLFWNGERLVSAHRYSFELFTNKSIPPELGVLHVCGNNKCVNPAHLYLGTAKENAEDRDRHLVQRICYNI